MLRTFLIDLSSINLPDFLIHHHHSDSHQVSTAMFYLPPIQIFKIFVVIGVGYVITILAIARYAIDRNENISLSRIKIVIIRILGVGRKRAILSLIVMDEQT